MFASREIHGVDVWPRAFDYNGDKQSISACCELKLGFTCNLTHVSSCTQKKTKPQTNKLYASRRSHGARFMDSPSTWSSTPPPLGTRHFPTPPHLLVAWQTTNGQLLWRAACSPAFVPVCHSWARAAINCSDAAHFTFAPRARLLSPSTSVTSPQLTPTLMQTTNKKKKMLARAGTQTLDSLARCLQGCD